MTVAFPVSDTYTDVALTIDWLQPDSPDRWYGRISASILCVASIVPACFMLAVETELGREFRAARLYDPGNGRFHPMLGFVLSVTQTRLPVTAALQMYDIARNGVHEALQLAPARKVRLEMCGLGEQVVARHRGLARLPIGPPRRSVWECNRVWARRDC